MDHHALSWDISHSTHEAWSFLPIDNGEKELDSGNIDGSKQKLRQSFPGPGTELIYSYAQFKQKKTRLNAGSFHIT